MFTGSLKNIVATGTPLTATTRTAADTTTTKAEGHRTFSEAVISTSHIIATKIRKSQTIPTATEVPKTAFKVCTCVFQHLYPPNFL